MTEQPRIRRVEVYPRIPTYPVEYRYDLNDAMIAEVHRLASALADHRSAFLPEPTRVLVPSEWMPDGVKEGQLLGLPLAASDAVKELTICYPAKMRITL